MSPKKKRLASLSFLVILLMSLAISGWALSQTLNRHARDYDASRYATVLLEIMNSVRDYTSGQVQPILKEQLATHFWPQSVPSYAAQQIFERLRLETDYAKFSYKEAAINPTNLRDKADSFEAEIIQTFQQTAPSSKAQVSGIRPRSQKDFFYLARPIIVSSPSCLQCHSTPDVAPKAMVEFYGQKNGFGWQLNQVIGAQIVYLPVETLSLHYRGLLLKLLVVFATVLAIALVLLQRQIS